MRQEELSEQHIYQPSKSENKAVYKKLAFFFALFIFVFGVIATLYFGNNQGIFKPMTTQTAKDFKLEKFSSEEDFQAYLSSSRTESLNTSLFSSQFRSLDFAGEAQILRKGTPALLSPEPERFSETNVQVPGIDEPDSIKTDGQNIYFSRNLLYRPMPLSVSSGMPEVNLTPPIYDYENNTKIINALPVSNLTVSAEIEASGDLLYFDKILAIFEGSKITGFDVSNPSSPQQVWQIDFDQNEILTSRLKTSELLAVIKSTIDIGHPCPMPLFSEGELRTLIPCNEIFHPNFSVDVDTTFTVLKIDIKTGATKSKVSFVGSSRDSVVYVSNDFVYATNTGSTDILAFLDKFFTLNQEKLLPENVVAKISELKTYPISTRAKVTEIQTLLETHLSTLSSDERLKFEQNFANLLTLYSKEHLRELEETLIFKINFKNMEIAQTGKIAGTPLNQWSLDEYQGNLRVATTVGQNQILPVETANNLYVLNPQLETIGKLTDLAPDERIYSARFVGDKAYLVTYKQIDPFFVIDLKTPNNPQVAGEIKLPGFSSYLHPIETNLILGVGSDNGRMKLSLFDTLDPTNPKEIANYFFSEYRGVSFDHKAILFDPKHKLFFIPGSSDAFIFSYQEAGLELIKAIANAPNSRAVFINDNLYITDQQALRVFNENTLEKVGEIAF